MDRTRIKNCLTALLTAAAFASCSNIAEDERLIFVEDKTIITTITKGPVPTVLVEDFTGQKCTWCPQGTRILEEQIALYGKEKVIPVAIHSGRLGFKGTATSVGLMTDLGIYYWNKNGFTNETSQPTAVINRRHTTDNRDSWGSLIYEELTRKVDINVEFSTEYDEETRELTVTAACFGNVSAEGFLQVWLTESNITAMQIDEGETRKDYIHNHVLRAAINGNDGEEVAITATPTEKTYTYTIPQEYDVENCQIVAFVYNGSGVLQAKQKKI